MTPIFRLITLSFFVWSSHQAYAADVGDCLRSTLKQLAGISPNVGLEREALIQSLGEKGVPAFIYENGNGSIPVILVTPETVPQIKEFLDHSVGIQVMTRQEWPNDHGSIRFGQTIADAFVPGERKGNRELNETGISWNNVKDMAIHRDKIADRIVDVSYALTPDEMKVVELYQRVRRAAIYRVRFSMGSQASYAKHRNVIQNSSDQCFGFCRSSSLSSQIQEMRTHLQTLGVKNDVDEWLDTPEVRDYLLAAEKELMSRDPNAESFNESILLSAVLRKKFDAIKPKGLSKNQEPLFADWLMATNAASKYRAVMQNLGVPNHHGVSDLNSPRATALLFFEDANKAQEFHQGTYDGSGKSWRFDGGQRKPIESTGVQNKLHQGQLVPARPLNIEQIHYKVLGAKNKETLVLIHGLGGNMKTWDSVATDLAKKFKVVLYDQRGHGGTAAVGENFSSATMAGDLKVLLDHLGVDKATVLGHSMGGRTALRFANLYPDRVNGVIVEDMHAIGRRTLLPDHLNRSRDIRRKLKSEYASESEARAALKAVYGPDYAQEVSLEKTPSGGVGLGHDPASTILYSTQGLQEDLTEALRSIQVPLLFLAGDGKEKGAVLFGKGIDHIRETQPKARIEIFRKGGHGLHWSHRQSFLDQVQKFMGQ